MAHKSFTLAIRILHELTLFSSPHPLRELARTLHVSASYLEQTIRPLRRAGIVLGTKGPRGGYVLSRNLATVTVEDILTLYHPRANLIERRCLNLSLPLATLVASL